MRKIIKTLLIVAILPFSVFIYNVITEDEELINDKEYLTSLNLELTGQILKIDNLDYGHNYGIVTIGIKYSHPNQYDPRQSKSRYLGIINENQAKLVVHNIGFIQTDDSIFVKDGKFKITRNDKLVFDNHYLDLPPSSLVHNPYTEINEKM